MDEQQLHQILWALSSAELYQQKTGENYNAMQLDYIHHPIAKIPKANFFNEGNISINRSPRFSYVPAHSHSFIEMNYVYNGQSVQIIDDQRYVLPAGTLLVMDTGVVHRVDYADRDDILINLLINHDNAAPSALLEESSANNITDRFLRNSLQKNFNHDNYVIYDLNRDIAMRHLMDSIIAIGVQHLPRQSVSLEALMKVLVGNVDSCIVDKSLKFVDVNDNQLIPMINYINDHYQTVTLKELSKQFGYNPNYVSNRIKKQTGRTFKQLVELRRLAVAENLMIRTKLSASDITEMVGYQNFSSLYRLFEEYLNLSPQEYKKKVTPKKIEKWKNFLITIK